ncbi:YwqJ-related putative deaminase [Streptococcus oricebi]|uniref:YwqJ-related putative deaminase n=1 Tax=Streptococcus oricebi TaxID=1547447 RepID=UPI001AE21AA7|nr:YwqJ-related putative deaminase [Streptococcus oricebi]
MEDLHPLLKERTLNASQEVKDSYLFTKGFASHAEIYAVNEALKANPNASIDDLLVNVIRTGQNKNYPLGLPFKRCPHCAYILDGFHMVWR